MSEVAPVTTDSCLMSYKWDWKNYPDREQELYRLNRLYTPQDEDDPWNYGQDIITTKNRIRGRGTALSIKLTSPPGTACKVTGLAVLYMVEL